MVWPMLVALAIWGTAALFLWARLAIWLAGVLRPWIEPTLGYVRLDFGDAAMIAANVVLFLLFVPMVYLTALFILGIFGMQKMVDYVASRSFPHLERRHGGTTMGSLWNGIVAFVGMLLLFIVSLPLWILPPLWPLIPLAILVGQPAAAALRRAGGARRHGGDAAPVQRTPRLPLPDGRASGLLAYVPFVDFIGPVVFGLAFIRYLLGALRSRLGRTIACHPNKELAAGNTPS